MESAVGTGGQGGYTALPDFGRYLTLLQPGGQIIPTTLLLDPPTLRFSKPSYGPDKWKLQSSAYGVPPGQFFNLANLNATEVI